MDYGVKINKRIPDPKKNTGYMKVIRYDYIRWQPENSFGVRCNYIQFIMTEKSMHVSMIVYLSIWEKKD